MIIAVDCWFAQNMAQQFIIIIYHYNGMVTLSLLLIFQQQLVCYSYANNIMMPLFTTASGKPNWHQSLTMPK